jgi:L,D-transpeptidase-like protein/putative peptidoglycan binding protein
MRRLPVLLVVLAFAPAASAQLPAPTTPPVVKPKPAPAPKPATGTIAVRVRGGLVDRRKHYFVPGQRVGIAGRFKPFVHGQFVKVEVFRGRRRVAALRVPLQRARRGATFAARFTARRRGVYVVRARHDATPQLARAVARARKARVLRPRAGQGAHGVKVRLLQRALRSLGYAAPASGRFDSATSRAVLAFRKVNRMARSGYASGRVYGKLFRHRGGFHVRYPRAGRHVEFDWSRQVLVLARGGRAERIIHASSGKSSTPTVFGSFRFYSKTPGTNAKGMVDSNYFHGGYAVHGYHEVPTYPASHGCIRIPIPSAAAVYRSVRLGERIFVYR